MYVRRRGRSPPISGRHWSECYDRGEVSAGQGRLPRGKQLHVVLSYEDTTGRTTVREMARPQTIIILPSPRPKPWSGVSGLTTSAWRTTSSGGRSSHHMGRMVEYVEIYLMHFNLIFFISINLKLSEVVKVVKPSLSSNKVLLLNPIKTSLRKLNYLYWNSSMYKSIASNIYLYSEIYRK